MKVRRRKYQFFQVEDRLFPDVELLLQGQLQMKTVTHSLLLCPLTGDKILCSAEELGWLASLPAEGWHELPAALASLVPRRVVIAEGPAGQELAEAEAEIDRAGWHPYAALYHRLTAWSGLSGQAESSTGELRDHLDAHAATYGRPPHHFYRVEGAVSEHPLPAPATDDALSQLLRHRRTARCWQEAAVLPLADLSAVLNAVFGTQGIYEWAEGMAALKKFTPSGGGLHPIEAWPLVARVEGLSPGLYHYRCQDHVLELVEALSEAEVRDWITSLTAGQTYFSGVQCCVVHVARYARNFWKYRQHAKVYKAVLMDSAHLSQTFYLAAAQRGLGAYFTAALNDGDFGQRLGFQPLEMGCVAVNGLGIADPTNARLDFFPDPYDMIAQRSNQ